MSYSEILTLHKSVLSGCTVKTLHSLHYIQTDYGTTGGRTDTHEVYRSVTFNRSCNVLKINPSGKKQHTVPNVCQNRKPYRTRTLFQFSATPSPILGTTETATFAHFKKKSMHLKTRFLLDYRVLFLLLHGPQIKKVCSLIDRFRSIYDVRM